MASKSGKLTAADVLKQIENGYSEEESEISDSSADETDFDVIMSVLPNKKNNNEYALLKNLQPIKDDTTANVVEINELKQIKYRYTETGELKERNIGLDDINETELEDRNENILEDRNDLLLEDGNEHLLDDRNENMETDDLNPTELEDVNKPRERKKKYQMKNESKWKRNKEKIRRGKGLGYKTKKGLDRSERKMGKTCNSAFCKKSNKRNCSEILESMRKNIFTKFWVEFNWEKRHVFVSSLIKRVEIKQKKTEVASRRNFSWTYYLPHAGKSFQVCKHMFSSTLGVSDRTLLSWACPLNDENTEPTDPDTSLEIISEEGLKAVEKPKREAINKAKELDLDFLNTFLSSLSTVESHYCRAAYADQKFLEPGTSIINIYQEYVNSAKENNAHPLSYPIFHRIFNESRYSVFVPRKDQCDICIGFKHQNIQVAEYNNHILAIDAARNEKTDDVLTFKDDPLVSVWSMDLQAVLLCPKTHASCMYYKTKLKTHNFTLYNMDSRDGYNYVWDECNGDLSSQVFAWLQYSHFKEQLEESPEIETLIVWSDGCGYQNRNSVVSSAYYYLARKMGITVIQKFLVAGHTQMECDSMHSTIEKKIVNPIYSPRDYSLIMQVARQKPRPYIVRQLEYTYFKRGFPLIPSIRPGRKVGDPTVHTLRALRYTHDNVEFKTAFDDPWQPIPQRLPANTEVNFESIFKGQLPITKRKFDDLQALKTVIPLEIHAFYDNLPYE